MTLIRACNLVGLPNLVVDSKEAIAEFHNKWRVLVVNARERNDDQTAAVLSEAWAFVKKRQRKYCECGAQKSPSATSCPMCARVIKKEKRNNMKKPEMPEIPGMITGVVEDCVPIPARTGRPGAVLEQLSKLERVGQSVVIRCCYMSAAKAASTLKMKCSTHVIKDADGNKTGYTRIWRTDGMTLDEVNKIIAERTKTT